MYERDKYRSPNFKRLSREFLGSADIVTLYDQAMYLMILIEEDVKKNAAGKIKSGTKLRNNISNLRDILRRIQIKSKLYDDELKQILEIKKIEFPIEE